MMPQPTAYKINWEGEWEVTFNPEKIAYAEKKNLQMIPLYDAAAIKQIVINEFQVIAGRLDPDDLVAASYADWMVEEAKTL